MLLATLTSQEWPWKVILNMDYVEKKALSALNKLFTLHARYVDDAFLLTRSYNDAEQIKDIHVFKDQDKALSLI